jgi:hypothetical protein
VCAGSNPAEGAQRTVDVATPPTVAMERWA